MPHPEEYDLVVLGSGEAGKYLAWTLAKKGMRAVVIERKYIGGSCPNIACMPSKILSTARKSPPTFGEAENSESPRTIPRSICRVCAIESARWWMEW